MSLLSALASLGAGPAMVSPPPPRTPGVPGVSMPSSNALIQALPPAQAAQPAVQRGMTPDELIEWQRQRQQGAPPR